LIGNKTEKFVVKLSPGKIGESFFALNRMPQDAVSKSFVDIY
jgi:hypothetical protein